MAEAVENTYRAFLSYSHKDADAAAWLHRKLEGWRIDGDLVGKQMAIGPVPKTLRPIFRDRDDFAGGHSLADATISALEASQFLIVLCSPDAARSVYVNEEVRQFKALGRSDRVIPVIVAGEPGSAEQECFPPAVRFLVDDAGAVTQDLAEPVAPDFRDVGDGRERAAAKVVAGLLGVRYDDIVQRARRADRKRRLQLGAAGVSFAVIAAAGGYYYWQSAHLVARDELNQQEITKLKSLVQSLITTSASASEAGGDGFAGAIAEGVEQALISAQVKANAGDARMALALELLKQNNVEQAEALYRDVANEKALRIGAVEADIKKERADAAAAFRNLGAIAKLSDPQRAREAYSRALEFEPDDKQTLITHADMYWRAGDYKPAIKSYFHLLAILEGPRDDHHFHESHKRLGDIAWREGSMTRARGHHEAAIQLAQKRVAQEPENSHWQGRLAASHMHIGDISRVSGDMDGALDSYRSFRSIYRRLTDLKPDDTSRQFWLGLGHERVGYVLLKQGNTEEAFQAFKARHAIISRLAASKPENTRWQRDLFVSTTKLGDALNAQGNLAAALGRYLEGRALAERLVKIDPDSKTHQRDLSKVNALIGDVQFLRGHRTDALASYRDALVSARNIAATNPRNVVWQEDLSELHDKIGDVHMADGRYTEAYRSYRDSYNIRKFLVTVEPENMAWKRDLAKRHVKLADVHVRQDNREAAIAELKSAKGVMLKLVQSAPDKPGWQEALAGIEQRIDQLLQQP